MSRSDDYFIFAADLVNKNYLRDGAFGDVYKALYFEKAVAIKEIKVASNDRQRVLESLQLEVDVLRNARHPNVVLFMGANLEERKPFIVTEYAPGGNLEEVLKKGGLDQATKLQFAIDVALGMHLTSLAPDEPLPTSPCDSRDAVPAWAETQDSPP
jgi:serine/threonine protein kinase